MTTFISKKSYSPEYGARPIDRAINDFIVNPLSINFLSPDFDKTKELKISFTEEGELLKEEVEI